MTDSFSFPNSLEPITELREIGYVGLSVYYKGCYRGATKWEEMHGKGCGVSMQASCLFSLLGCCGSRWLSLQLLSLEVGVARAKPQPDSRTWLPW